MSTKQKLCLVVEVKKLALEENPVGRAPVKEGRNLPNSVTEDVGGFSLYSTYSEKQLRRIERLRRSNAERNGIKNAMSTLKLGGRLQW